MGAPGKLQVTSYAELFQDGHEQRSLSIKPNSQIPSFVESKSGIRTATWGLLRGRALEEHTSSDFFSGEM